MHLTNVHNLEEVGEIKQNLLKKFFFQKNF